MSPQTRARILTLVAASLMLLTAGFHLTGFPEARELGRSAGGKLTAIVPLLWIAFSIDIMSFAIVSAIIAWRPGPTGRPILLAAAIPPFGAACLQIVYIGFRASTAVLCADVALLVAAAAGNSVRSRLHDPSG